MKNTSSNCCLFVLEKETFQNFCLFLLIPVFLFPFVGASTVFAAHGGVEDLDEGPTSDMAEGPAEGEAKPSLRKSGEFWRLLPRLYSMDESKLNVALQLSYVNHRGRMDDNVSLTGTALELDDPNDEMKFAIFQFQTERRFYLNSRFYWGLGGGLLLFAPRSALANFFSARGEELDSTIEPYAKVFIAWQIGRVPFFGRKYPLILRLGYTKASPIDFPSTLPDGTGEIDVSGIDYGLGFRFRY